MCTAAASRPIRAVILLLAAGLTAPLEGCAEKKGGKGPGEELVVISPHDETVRYELSRAFESYAGEKTGKKVGLRWQPARGTGNIMRFLENEMKSAEGGREVGIDVFLGGGAPAHEKARASGITEPVRISDEISSAVPDTLGGVHLKSPGGHWYGVTVSSFGIIYNKIGLERRNIEEPESWKDLADPRYENLLILADPFESGSARACYEMILQRFGWNEGWAILLRIMANAGSFTHSSSDIVREISNGQSAAGMVIDIYAFVQIEKDGEDVIGYTLPAGETTFTPDPVSVIKGTPKKRLARLFIEFLLSREGQQLWFLAPGEKGGPETYSLLHFPVRPDVYEIHEGGTTVEGNPFKAFAALRYDETKGAARARAVTLVFETAGTQNRDLLKKAWKTIRAGPDPDLVETFEALPLSEEEAPAVAGALDDPVRAEILEEKYYRYFRGKYKFIIENGR